MIRVLCRLVNAESTQDSGTLMSKDVDIVEGKGKQLKISVKYHSRISKVEYPLDCGADADTDQHCQGEKVSSLKTVSSLATPSSSKAGIQL